MFDGTHAVIDLTAKPSFRSWNKGIAEFYCCVSGSVHMCRKV